VVIDTRSLTQAFDALMLSLLDVGAGMGALKGCNLVKGAAEELGGK
jgi:hypothetical protein